MRQTNQQTQQEIIRLILLVPISDYCISGEVQFKEDPSISSIIGFNSKQIASLDLSNLKYLKVIEKKAFGNNKHLKSIVFGGLESMLETIEDSAFE